MQILSVRRSSKVTLLLYAELIKPILESYIEFKWNKWSCNHKNIQAEGEVSLVRDGPELEQLTLYLKVA